MITSLEPVEQNAAELAAWLVRLSRGSRPWRSGWSRRPAEPGAEFQAAVGYLEPPVVSVHPPSSCWSCSRSSRSRLETWLPSPSRAHRAGTKVIRLNWKTVAAMRRGRTGTEYPGVLCWTASTRNRQGGRQDSHGQVTLMRPVFRTSPGSHHVDDGTRTDPPGLNLYGAVHQVRYLGADALWRTSEGQYEYYARNVVHHPVPKSEIDETQLDDTTSASAPGTSTRTRPPA